MLKRSYYQNYCINHSQILHSDRNRRVGPTLRGWSKCAQNKSKMADGGHFWKKNEKSQYICNW